MSWVQRPRREFGIEIDSCQRCGDRLGIVASIEPPQVIAKIFPRLERTPPRQQQTGLPLGARAPPVPSCLI